MTLRKGLEFQLVYLIASLKRPVQLTEILKYYPGITDTNTDHINDYLDSLINEKFIEFEGGGYRLSAKGSTYFEGYNNYSDHLIFGGKFDLAVMKFLSDMNSAVSYNQFPANMLDHAPASEDSSSREFNLKNHLRYDSVFKNYFSAKENFITLNESGKSYYDLLVRKEAERNSAEMELQNKSLKQENRKLRQELKDYKWLKFERSILVLIAIIFLIWAILSTIRTF